MRRQSIGILFVALLGLILVYEVDQKDMKQAELEKKELIFQDSLVKLKKDRSFVYKDIDTLYITNTRIKEKIKTVTVYVPGKFDTLFNKDLQATMLAEYINFNQ